MVRPVAPSVGVFDSGVGGLSVLRAVRACLPQHDLIYVADSGHAPYGDRSPAFIRERVQHLSRFLIARQVQALVIACNTASVHAAQALRVWCPVPVVAMEPAIKPAAHTSRSRIVGVLATTQTLASENVSRLVKAFGGETRILLQACPGLVEYVERGDISSADVRALTEQYLRPLLDQGADTLVLGCTHYPFLRPVIEVIAGPCVDIIDPAPAIARELLRRLGMEAPAPDMSRPEQTAAYGAPAGREMFFSTGHILSVQTTVRRLWDSEAVVLALPDDPF
jgi:glutamate racemase